jgi:hypothetical protein
MAGARPALAPRRLPFQPSNTAIIIVGRRIRLARYGQSTLTHRAALFLPSPKLSVSPSSFTSIVPSWQRCQSYLPSDRVHICAVYGHSSPTTPLPGEQTRAHPMAAMPTDTLELVERQIFAAETRTAHSRRPVSVAPLCPLCLRARRTVWIASGIVWLTISL